MRIPLSDSTGYLDHFHNFYSLHVPSRHVDIWYPSLYGQQPDLRFPVVYMHDGQNLFDPGNAFGGVDWGMDETIEDLIEEGYAPGMIVVGIWNTPQRYQEYMPAKPLFAPRAKSLLKRLQRRHQELPTSDLYLRFIVEELKPFVDTNYRTLPDQPHTFVMGSSMGGLISAYAVSEYPRCLEEQGACPPIGLTGVDCSLIFSEKHYQRQAATSCTSTSAPRVWMQSMNPTSKPWTST